MRYVRVPRYGLLDVLRHAASDILRARLLVFLMCVTVVSVVVFQLMASCNLASCIYRAAEESVDEVDLRRVTAIAPMARRQFTSAALAAVSGWPDVAYAGGHVELNLLLHCGSRSAEGIVEGTGPADPGLAPGRLVRGRGFTGKPHEIVLTERLWRELPVAEGLGGGPAEVAVEVRRTVGGKTEARRVVMEVVGVVPGQVRRAYLPLATARQLDWWITNVLSGLVLAGESAAGTTRFDKAHAYVPADALGRLAEVTRGLRIRVQRSGEIETLQADGSVWASVGRRDGLPLAARHLEVVRGLGAPVPQHTVYVVAAGAETILGLSAADPRWAKVSARTSDPVAAVAVSDTSGLLQPAGAGTAVRVTSFDGLRYIAFDPERSEAARRVAFVQCADSDLALELLRLPGAKVEDLAEGPSWAVLAESPAAAGEAEAAPACPADGAWGDLPPRGGEIVDVRWPARSGRDEVMRWLSSSWPRCAAGVCPSGAEWVLGGELGSSAVCQMAVRVLPAGAFDALAGRCRSGGRAASIAAGPSPAILVGSGTSKPGTLYALGRRLDVVKDLQAEQPELWVRAAEGMPQVGRDRAIVVVGRWQAIAEIRRDLPAGWRVAGRSGSSRYRGVVHLSRREVIRRLGRAASACEVREWTAIPCLARTGPSALDAMGALAITPCGPHHAGASDRGVYLRGGAERLRLSSGEWTSGELRGLDDPELPEGVVVVGPGLYKRLAFEAARPQAVPGKPRVDLCFPDAAAFVAAERRGRDLGLALNGLTPTSRRMLVRFEVRDADGGPVSGELIAAVGMARPVFVQAWGLRQIRGTVLGQDAPLCGLPVAAPERFLLQAGRWFQEADAPECVCDRRLADKLFDAPQRALGQALPLRIIRRDRCGREESLVLRLRVVGLTDGTFIPAELADNLHLWQRQERDYRNERFAHPVEIEKDKGFTRAKLYAARVEAVGDIVARLEASGYVVEHNLANQENLQHLRTSLQSTVILIVMGSLLGAVLVVLSTNAMGMEAKQQEMAVLRSQGVSRWGVFRIFAAEALIIGATAFSLAAVACLLFEPFLRSCFASAFGIRPQVFQGHPTSVMVGPLAGLGIGVAVGFSLLGVAGPSFIIVRQPLVKALKRL